MASEDIPAAREVPRTSGSRIKKERERRAWTQADLAKKIGSSRINISRWENGASLPGPYFRQKLSGLFGKSVEELGFLSALDEEDINEAPIFTHDAEHSGTKGIVYRTESISYSEQAQDTSSVVSEFDDSARSTQSATLWHMPYRPNLFFTGRKEILQHLHDEFSHGRNSGGVLALSGLGGVGKTQIAIEYAYTYRQDYQAIFWLNASTHATFSSDLVALASLLDIPELREQEEIISEMVKRWLARHSGWLLILDNVDTLEEVDHFLPLYSEGDVLLTTRLQVVGTIGRQIVVENMSKEEGIDFLLRRAKLIASGKLAAETMEESRKQAEQIVTTLGGLPLALDQAGAYIEETHCGLAQYLDRYETHSKELLWRRGSFPLEHPDPVATTWEISFKEIKRISAESVELLYLCAFLSSDSIPEDLLIVGSSKLGPILSKALGNHLQLDAVLQPLYLYSLIQRSPEIHSLTIHRLVQAVLRQNLPAAQQEQWAKRIIQAIDYTFPEPTRANWSRCQQLLAQVPVCIQLAEEYSLLLPELAHLCQQAGQYAFDRAMYAEAEVFFQKAISTYELLSSCDGTEGMYNGELDTNRFYLGRLHRVRGRYEEAEELLLHVLKNHEQTPLRNQATVVEIFNTIGELYHNTGRYEEAEPFFQRALSTTQSIFGPDHYPNANPLHYLARLYQDEQRYEEAESIFVQVVQMQKQSPDQDEVELAITLNNLATLYRKRGEYEKATTLLQQTLTIFGTLLGSDHPRTAIALQNLGIIHLKQGNYEEAETFLERALKIKQDILGPNNRSTIKTIANLAFVFKQQRRYEAAKNLLQQALRSVDKEQLQTAVILRTLASVYYEEKNYVEAKNLYHQALAISEKDPAHREMSTVLESLENLYETLGKKEEAEDFRQRKNLLDHFWVGKEASPENS